MLKEKKQISKRSMYSLTHGEVTLEKAINIIDDFINKSPESKYQISVGTDSQNHDLTKIIVVIAIHKIGNGGFFFYETRSVRKITNVRQKIFYETNLSLELAMKLSKQFQDKNLDYGIDIHVDAGPNGASSKTIPEISAWIRSCGFECKTKPESYAASAIANKYSK